MEKVKEVKVEDKKANELKPLHKPAQKIETAKFQPYVKVGEYLKNGATSDQLKAVESLERQIGFSLGGAFVENDAIKPIVQKKSDEVSSASRLVLHWHKQFYAYVEQSTLTTLGGVVCKRVK